MARHSYQVFVGLGASIQPGNRGQALNTITGRLDRAVQALQQHALSHLTGCSNYYETRPWGPRRPGRYLNTVACLRTQLTPALLLHHLLRLEHQLGRQRSRKRWGPRSIDIDILLYNNLSISMHQLHVPHPWMWQREFVLQPLLELQKYLSSRQQQQLQISLRHSRSHLLRQPRRIPAVTLPRVQTDSADKIRLTA